VSPRSSEEKAAQTRVAGYDENQLLILVAHVRSALARLDAGEIDVFEFDAVAHQYKKAAQSLWSFCNGTERDIAFTHASSRTNKPEGKIATGGSS
jgi:hypothetical protein